MGRNHTDAILPHKLARPRRGYRLSTRSGVIASAQLRTRSTVSGSMGGATIYGSGGTGGSVSTRHEDIEEFYLQFDNGRQDHYEFINQGVRVAPGHEVTILHGRRGKRSGPAAVVNHTTGTYCYGMARALRKRTRWSMLRWIAISLLVVVLLKLHAVALASGHVPEDLPTFVSQLHPGYVRGDDPLSNCHRLLPACIRAIQPMPSTLSVYSSSPLSR